MVGVCGREGKELDWLRNGRLASRSPCQPGWMPRHRWMPCHHARRTTQSSSRVQELRLACHAFSHTFSHCRPLPRPCSLTSAATLHGGGWVVQVEMVRGLGQAAIRVCQPGQQPWQQSAGPVCLQWLVSTASWRSPLRIGADKLDKLLVLVPLDGPALGLRRRSREGRRGEGDGCEHSEEHVEGGKGRPAMRCRLLGRPAAFLSTGSSTSKITPSQPVLSKSNSNCSHLALLPHPKLPVLLARAQAQEPAGRCGWVTGIRAGQPHTE